MSNDYAVFHSLNGKRRLLVADASSADRDALSSILQEDYELFFAENGRQVSDLSAMQSAFLSLIILDSDLPGMSGTEVLQQLKSHSSTENIPVIAVSSDEMKQAECLRAGAIDFICKPYPQSDVLTARIQQIIELSEGRQIIRATERDPLTGLLRPDYFYEYAAQYDHFHASQAMDAIALDIHHFDVILQRYGRDHMNEMLRRMGRLTGEAAREAGGIACQGGDAVFYIYCPHQKDYQVIFDRVAAALDQEYSAGRVRLCMGVYPRVDKTLPIQRCLARAKIASDTILDNMSRSIAFYDETLHGTEMRKMQMIRDFSRDLKHQRFTVLYQPVFNTRMQQSLLVGGEALVRWEHPHLGTILPDEFIPVLESQGLILDLDRYVWEIVAEQIRSWKDTYGFCIPIFVNLSRIDLYDSNLIYTMMNILEKYDLDAGDFHLEFAESACSEDPERIEDSVKRLRAMGFTIVMDEYAAISSSLQILTSLSIDMLKLDVVRLRTAFGQEQYRRILETLKDTASRLSLPVIAEHVEDAEELQFLKKAGFRMIQGFCFSPPVPAEEFAPFLDEAKQTRENARIARENFEMSNASTFMTAVQSDNTGERFSDILSQRVNFHLRSANLVFVLVAFFAALCLFMSTAAVNTGYQNMDEANNRLIQAEQATTDLEMASDFLTEQVRLFVMLGDIQYLNNYFEELNVTKRRNQAVTDLKELLQGKDNAAYQQLSAALRQSDELVDLEYHAMKLTLESGDYDMSGIPEVLQEYTLPPGEEALSDTDKENLAKSMVVNQDYLNHKAKIKTSTAACSRYLMSISKEQHEQAQVKMGQLLHIQRAFILIFLLIVLGTVVFISIWIRRPLNRMVSLLKARQTIPPSGAAELCFISETYNDLFEENLSQRRRLTYGKMHDGLTGLYNRYAYDIMRESIDLTDHALVLFDVNQFRSINEKHGRETGDRILLQMTKTLCDRFRTADLIFRMGGDEFAVIMPSMDSSKISQAERRIEQVRTAMLHPEDDLPPVSISVGTAFADPGHPEKDIFQEAADAMQAAEADLTADNGRNNA